MAATPDSAIEVVSATGMARALAANATTCEALTRAALTRIAALEPGIQAWETIDAEGALRQARDCDAALRSGAPRGPLFGIPIAVKDIIETAGLPARFGSPIYAGNVPLSDAACVAIARAAGAIVIGKTVTTELAVFHPGKTRNPRAPGHTPGGSSSGSAAAVAAQMVPLALGTQTAGSVIRPASFCGVVGYKPTFGLIPRAGAKPQCDSLDTIGVFANSVADAALFSAALSGDARLVQNDGPAAAPCIGLCRTFEWAHAAPDMQAAIAEAARRLAEAGARVTPVELPAEFGTLVAAQKDIQLFEACRAYAFEYTVHRDLLSAKLVAILEEGRTIRWPRYLEARRHASHCRELIARVFRDCDALLMPAAAGEAPAGLEATGDPVFNRAATVLHVPAISLPGLTGAHDLPLGMQLLGAAWNDAQLLRTARWAEGALAA